MLDCSCGRGFCRDVDRIGHSFISLELTFIFFFLSQEINFIFLLLLLLLLDKSPLLSEFLAQIKSSPELSAMFDSIQRDAGSAESMDTS